MPRTISFLIFFLSFATAYPQFLHTPSETQQYIEQSGLKLIHQPLMQPVTFDWPVLTDNWVRTSSGDSTFLMPFPFETHESIKKSREEVNFFIKEGKKEKAIEQLLLALNSSPPDITMMHQLADLFLQTNQYAKAVNTLKQLTALNPIDRTAYRMLADAYLYSAEPANALYPITYAHLLNRNDANTLEKLISIYETNGLKYEEWSFKPQYQLTEKDNSVIVSVSTKPWEAYADCQALWQYGENYQIYMSGISNEAIEIIREKECLLNAVIAFEQLENGKEDFPELKSLASAIGSGQIDNFIFYEITARYDPLQLSLLPDSALKELAEYVLRHRALPAAGQ